METDNDRKRWLALVGGFLVVGLALLETSPEELAPGASDSDRASRRFGGRSDGGPLGTKKNTPITEEHPENRSSRV